MTNRDLPNTPLEITPDPRDGSLLQVRTTDGSTMSEGHVQLLAGLATCEALAALSEQCPAGAELMLRQLLRHLADFCEDVALAQLGNPKAPVLAHLHPDQPNHPGRRGVLSAIYNAALIINLYAATSGDFQQMARHHAKTLAEEFRHPIEDLRQHEIYRYAYTEQMKIYTERAARAKGALR